MACLTLDLENDWRVGPEYDFGTFQYIEEFAALLDRLGVPLTVFAVGRVVEQFPDVVDRFGAAPGVEVHLHSYAHELDADFESDLRRGIEAFETHLGERPVGYRAPLGDIEARDLRILEDHGFEFDSSVFPSYRPGVYSNLDAPRTPYVPSSVDSLLEVPIATTPHVRIPITQSYLKLFGRPFQAVLGRVDLPDVVVFDSHLQDFYRTESHARLDLPRRLVHGRNLDRSLSLFEWFVDHLRSRGYGFVRVSEVVDRYA